MQTVCHRVPDRFCLSILKQLPRQSVRAVGIRGVHVITSRHVCGVHVVTSRHVCGVHVVTSRHVCGVHVVTARWSKCRAKARTRTRVPWHQKRQAASARCDPTKLGYSHTRTHNSRIFVRILRRALTPRLYFESDAEHACDAHGCHVTALRMGAT